MKVILINQFFHPDEAATSQFLTDLAVELRDRGHEVEVICGRACYRPGRVCELAGVAVHRVWSARGGAGLAGKAAGYLTFFVAAAARLASLPPADAVVVLSTPPMIGLLGLAARRWGHGRFIFWVQDIYPEIAESLGVLRGRPLNLIFQSMMADVYAGSDRIIVLGADMKQKLSDLYGAAGRVEVVHHWPLAGWEGDREAERRRLGWSREFVLLYSGNLGRAHEAATFLSAFEIFSKTNPDARLVVAGEGHGRPEVGAFIRAHPDLKIEMAGPRPREELAGFLAAADIHLASQRPQADGLVVPSKLYGILESGRPLTFVGSPRGEVAALIAQHGFGVRVEPGDAEALAAAWTLLRRDASKSAGMGKAAHGLARGLFSRNSGLSKLAALVEEA